MTPARAPRRFAPLLAGTAAGSLGPADLEEIGISIVAVDILELWLGVGFDRIDAGGGLGSFIGWDGPIVGVARYTEEGPVMAGWRGRGLPQLLKQRGDTIKLRSAIDGTAVDVVIDELRTKAAALGPGVVDATGDHSVKLWSGAGYPPGNAQVVVTDAANLEAGAGRYHSDSGWTDLATAAGGPLVAGCDCRTCGIAGSAYIAHLAAVHEITADHLLAWHNTHRLRRLVEAPA
ncbi:MAG: queuine tRNA-ribosyltransferase family protein [Candidatus Dormibacteraeota bacterium]|nr:queuine tRNA-ribosyltransferase family protein [Candidatus Dormibacteraeota bacterium]